jgi:phosphoglycerate dehydrogenase-like enzyme
MRIVVLDGLALEPEHLALLHSCGEVRAYPEMPENADELVARAAGAEVLINSWTRMDADVFARLPQLRMVSLASTGVDFVDLQAAARHGVAVCRVPHYATVAVAELALGLMLAVARRLPAVDREVRRTAAIEWDAPVGSELYGRTLGVVGTGAIGRRVAALGRALGMEVVAYDVEQDQALAREAGLRYAPLDDVFARSAVLTLHTPLVPATEGLADASRLALLPPGAIVVNTARRGLVDQDALCAALLDGRLGGAGLDDVDLSRESGRRLLALDNVVLTAHIGYKTRQAVANLAAVCTDNVVRFLRGEPRNMVAS